jgi:CHAT domain-containing protein/tetratricopeptide (TPR) repeat protein
MLLLILSPFSALAASDAAAIRQQFMELYNNGRYADAIPLARQELALHEKSGNTGGIGVALNNLGTVCRLAGDYFEAEKSLKKGLEIRKRVEGLQSEGVAVSLQNLAMLYAEMSRYGEAEPLYLQSVEIAEKALGELNQRTAEMLLNLAGFYDERGEYAKAEPFYNRGMKVALRVFPKDGPEVAQLLDSVGKHLYLTGKHQEAEQAFRRALELREKTLGADHPLLADSLNNLAVFYDNTARPEKGEELLLKAIAIHRKSSGADHPSLGTALNNLGSFYLKKERFPEAEKCFRETLAIYEKAFGAEHEGVSGSLNNLAQLYADQKRPPEALPLMERALSIDRKIFGESHPILATDHFNLGKAFDADGKRDKALRHFEESLRIRRQVLPSGHRDLANSLAAVGYLKGATGGWREGFDYLKRSLDIQEQNRETLFALMSEGEKLDYMNRFTADLYALLTIAATRLDKDRDAVDSAFALWTRWKGVVAESQERQQRLAESSGDRYISKRFVRLVEIRRQLAAEVSSTETTPAKREYFATLRKELESIDAELSRASSSYLRDKKAITIDAGTLSGELPQDAVYLDYAKVPFYDFASGKYGESRYLVFVLRPGRDFKLRLINCGSAATVENHLKAILSQMNRVKSEPVLPDKTVIDMESAALYSLLVKPTLVDNRSRRLVISPDAELNLVPFEIMRTTDGSYLAEKQVVRYLPAARDIFRPARQKQDHSPAVIVADPDYDLMMPGAKRNGSGSHGRLHFNPLPETRQELEIIAGLLEKNGFSTLKITGKEVTEERLLAVKKPFILHLATHGYFLTDDEVKAAAGTRGVKIISSVNSPKASLSSPMQRSGVALAGANVAAQYGNTNGLLTAEKILGMDLGGTDLVVLSACETGVGELQEGEGVFGLRRAFLISGVRSLVMSLWNVQSRETVELMAVFYRGLVAGKPKDEALRDAQLAVMKLNPNPYFWGGFVLAGSAGE